MSTISVEKTIAGVTITARGPRGLPGPAIQLRDNDGVLEWRVAKANPDPWMPLIDLGQFLSDSAAAAELARKWAAENEDVVVDEGLYSALHYAAKAAASAATAGSAASAAGDAKSEAEGARDLAKDWAEKADGQDVNGAGTRSAKHWAGQASSHASAASGHADTASSQAGIATSAAQDAADARDKAEAWAETEEDTEVEEGKYSAKHWAAKAEAAADAAALFDPASYYTKTEVDGALEGKADADAMSSALALKADTSAVTEALALKANTSSLGTAAGLNFTADGTLAGNSDGNVPTEKAVKSYVDGKWALLHVVEEKPQGTNGVVPTAASWNIRELNTIRANDIPGASLASKQITLPAGTYFTQAVAIAQRTAQNKIRLYSVTSDTTLMMGVNANAGSVASTASAAASLCGRFTLSGTAVIRLDHYVTDESGARLLGLSVGQGPEVYAELLIWKVA